MLCFHWLVKSVWCFVTDRVIQLQELFLRVCVYSAIYITSFRTVHAYFWIILYAYFPSSGLKTAQSTNMAANTTITAVLVFTLQTSRSFQYP